MTRIIQIIQKIIKGKADLSDRIEITENKKVSDHLFKIWKNAPDQTKHDQVDGELILQRIRHQVWQDSFGYRGKSFYLKRWSIAVACVVLLCALSYPLYIHLKPTYIIAKASHDEVFHLVLPDNSTVWLNGGSQLRYRKDFMKDRKVFLDGEGFFSVENVNNTPFEVHFKDAFVIVKGTEFNIRTDEEMAEVILISGKVDFGVRFSDQYIRMNPSDRIIYDYRTNEVKSLSKVNELYDWRSGNYKFTDKPLADLIEFINNMYNAQVRIDEKMQQHDYFSGTFRRDETLSDLIEKICISMDLKTREENGVIILY